MGVLETRGEHSAPRRMSAFAALPSRIYLDSRLSKAAIHIAGLLSASLNEDFEAGEFDLTSAVDLTGMPRSTMHRAIQILYKAGWLSQRQEARPHQKNAIFYRFAFDNQIPMEFDRRYSIEAKNLETLQNLTTGTVAIPKMGNGELPQYPNNETAPIQQMGIAGNSQNPISGTESPYIESKPNTSGLRPKAPTPKAMIEGNDFGFGGSGPSGSAGGEKTLTPTPEALEYWSLFQQLRLEFLGVAKEQFPSQRDIEIAEGWHLQGVERSSAERVFKYQLGNFKKKKIVPSTLAMIDADVIRYHQSQERVKANMPSAPAAKHAGTDALREAFHRASKYFSDRHIPGDNLYPYENRARRFSLPAAKVLNALEVAIETAKNEKRNPRSLFESLINKAIDDAVTAQKASK